MWIHVAPWSLIWLFKWSQSTPLIDAKAGFKSRYGACEVGLPVVEKDLYQDWKLEND